MPCAIQRSERVFPTDDALDREPFLCAPPYAHQDAVPPSTRDMPRATRPVDVIDLTIDDADTVGTRQPATGARRRPRRPTLTADGAALARRRGAGAGPLAGPEVIDLVGEDAVRAAAFHETATSLLECAMCLELFTHPRSSLLCGHTFCRHCLLLDIGRVPAPNVRRRNGAVPNAYRCAFCREPIRVRPHVNVTLERFVDAIVVAGGEAPHPRISALEEAATWDRRERGVADLKRAKAGACLPFQQSSARFHCAPLGGETRFGTSSCLEFRWRNAAARRLVAPRAAERWMGSGIRFREAAHVQDKSPLDFCTDTSTPTSIHPAPSRFVHPRKSVVPERCDQAFQGEVAPPNPRLLRPPAQERCDQAFQSEVALRTLACFVLPRRGVGPERCDQAFQSEVALRTLACFVPPAQPVAGARQGPEAQSNLRFPKDPTEMPKGATSPPDTAGSPSGMRADKRTVLPSATPESRAPADAAGSSVGHSIPSCGR
ncbi:hypothetical protein SCHPADRAFT_946052 [Schizopora paradoxa]|uniref:RING-type domain-containing protein n=1 Tax=Schizopora paradoxa TaxID=27342 RepID=A0A0H2R580_9AGAM|nr:hypothetical protein SCHPADRAFT_946052 [Schizopora paradoxa]